MNFFGMPLILIVVAAYSVYLFYRIFKSSLRANQKSNQDTDLISEERKDISGADSTSDVCKAPSKLYRVKKMIESWTDEAPASGDRVFVYIWFWIIAFFLTGPSAAYFLPLFPAGLFFALSPNSNENPVNFAVFGWFLYVIHAVFLFTATSKRLYIGLFVILLFMLLTNVVGCRKVLSGLSGAH
ncbi:MAG: hypothetical protein OEW48_19395 [Phycisphaerae bacterium]|nr:hypothetical protein [Phycisphaerae bacterium]